VRADAPEKIIIGMDFKGEAVKHIDTAFPSVFKTPHLFYPQGRMLHVHCKNQKFFIWLSTKLKQPQNLDPRLRGDDG